MNAYKLPHDLSEIQGKIPISALDANFDSLEAEVNALRLTLAALITKMAEFTAAPGKPGKKPKA